MTVFFSAMNKMTINWTWVFWISVTIVFLWLLAKALGFIQTPLLIESIPYVGSFVALLASAKKVGEYAQKIDRSLNDITEIKVEVRGVKEDIQGLRKDIHRLDKRLIIVETKIAA